MQKPWRTTPITLEQWKQNCFNSEHRRPNETLSFTEGKGKIYCGIEGTHVFLGTYFITGDGEDILPNTGWNH